MHKRGSHNSQSRRANHDVGPAVGVGSVYLALSQPARLSRPIILPGHKVGANKVTAAP